MQLKSADTDFDQLFTVASVDPRVVERSRWIISDRWKCLMQLKSADTDLDQLFTVASVDPRVVER